MSREPLPIVGRLQSLLDTMRGSYWFLPMLMALGAGIAALGLVALDRELAGSFVRRLPWIAATDAEGARAILSVIAGSMITVTGVVFSITIVALTLASSQFGPRLLRNFLRDRSNQLAFGTFVATFLYSLIVLRAVRENDVPHLASVVAVVLATMSLFVLIYFIHHTATSIQASSVIAAVANEIDAQVPYLFPEQLGKAGPDSASRAAEAALDVLSTHGTDVLAEADGFIRVLDQEAVLSLAVKDDLTIVLHRRPGDFACAGTSLARVGPVARVSDEAMKTLRESFVLGDHRTAVQDLQFLTGQLTEIALRALSPGINDPRTAADCMRRLGAVICATVNRDMPTSARYDDEKHLRIIAPATTFEEIASSCFDPIRRYGAGHMDVVLAFFGAIERAGQCCKDEERWRTLADHASAMHTALKASGRASPRDVAIAEKAFRKAMTRSAGESA